MDSSEDDADMMTKAQMAASVKRMEHMGPSRAATSSRLGIAYPKSSKIQSSETDSDEDMLRRATLQRSTLCKVRVTLKC